MNLLLHISGGLGKVIASTAVVRNWKIKYPESQIVVVSGYPEVYLHNPDITRNFNFSVPYLFQDWYSNPDWKIWAHDVYLTQAWIQNENRHLIEIWSEELQIECIQKFPLLFFSGPEVDELISMIQTDKPLMVVQSAGGSNPAARAWTRNPPREELDEYLGGLLEKNYVLHLAVPETPVLKNINQRIENLDRRKAMALIYYSYGFIGIDSFGLHARAANPVIPGPSIIFIPLPRSIKRLGYEKENLKLLTPKPEIQEIIERQQDYYATVFQYGIESVSENCPIPAGTRWFF